MRCKLWAKPFTLNTQQHNNTASMHYRVSLLANACALRWSSMDCDVCVCMFVFMLCGYPEPCTIYTSLEFRVCFLNKTEYELNSHVFAKCIFTYAWNEILVFQMQECWNIAVNWGALQRNNLNAICQHKLCQSLRYYILSRQIYIQYIYNTSIYGQNSQDTIWFIISI